MSQTIALQATRSEARHNHFDVYTMTAEDAQAVLDDLSRKEPELIACKWYREASDAQIKRFKQAWKKWQKENR